MSAVVMNGRMKRLIRYFQRQGAVGVQNAKSWSELNFPANALGTKRSMYRLLRKGILVRTPQDTYYLDMTALARFRASVLQIACAVGALAVLAAVLCLTGLIGV